MTELSKVSKLIEKLQVMIEVLESRPIIELHRNINQFYYMQKSTELQLLHDQLKEAMEREATIRLHITHCYDEGYFQWKKDKRWFNHFYRIGVKADQ